MQRGRLGSESQQPALRCCAHRGRLMADSIVSYPRPNLVAGRAVAPRGPPGRFLVAGHEIASKMGHGKLSPNLTIVSYREDAGFYSDGVDAPTYGVDVIKALLAKLPADFTYEPGLVVAEGDYVVIHGRYVGWGPKPVVAVDIFRVANGKIAEHWDVIQEEVPAAQTANGNSMLTAP